MSSKEPWADLSEEQFGFNRTSSKFYKFTSCVIYSAVKGQAG